MKDAIIIRKNITVYGPRSTIAAFRPIKELPQINIAKIREEIPIKLKFFVNLYTFFMKFL